MSTTTTDREQIITEIALGIEGANEDWAQGRATSPDALDYVIIARKVFQQRFPDFVESDREQDVADIIYEGESDGTLATSRDIATFLYDTLEIAVP